MKMVYSEWFGSISYAQRATYRKFNISPADHDDLVDQFGAHNHQLITDAVKAGWTSANRIDPRRSAV